MARIFRIKEIYNSFNIFLAAIMLMKKGFWFYCCILYLCSSCNPYKRIPYFQNVDYSTTSKEQINNFSPLIIQPADILGINVTSLNQEASAIFNNSGKGSNPDNNPMAGYLVNLKGEIKLPLIGSLKVEGLTTSDISEQIRKKLITYLKDPIVNIRILNFKISVLGDVGQPGVYSIENERITVLEALTLAGDLNITAKRDNLLLIREQKGEREYIPLNLTSKNVLQSNYYYLRNNDIIYVQPSKAKYASVDTNYRNLSLILSALSIVAIVFTRTFF